MQLSNSYIFQVVFIKTRLYKELKIYNLIQGDFRYILKNAVSATQIRGFASRPTTKNRTPTRISKEKILMTEYFSFLQMPSYNALLSYLKVRSQEFVQKLEIGSSAHQLWKCKPNPQIFAMLPN